MLAAWKKSYDKPRQHIKNQRHYFAYKGTSSQSYGFSSSHVWMWQLHHKESWALKNWCFWSVVLQKTLESHLDSKEDKPVNPKRNQSWIELEGLMLKLKPQYFGQLMQRFNSLEKTDAGKDWRQQKGMTEDKIVVWHHWLNKHEFEQIPGDGEGQVNLACCSPWGHKESDMTEWLKNNKIVKIL